LRSTAVEDTSVGAVGDMWQPLQAEEDFTAAGARPLLCIEIRAQVLSAGRLLRHTDSAVDR
jgi:hypothetical protein